MQETWKDVLGYEDRFMVSDCGRVFGKKSGKILKQSTTKDGYKTVSTRVGGRNGVCVSFRVHRLVAEAFLEPPSQELIEWVESTKYRKVPVNHKDGDKENNHYSNLQWVDYSENMKHAYDCGLKTSETITGELNASSKICEEAVRFIRKHYIPRDRQFGGRALSRRFGISHKQVQRILENCSWSSI